MKVRYVPLSQHKVFVDFPPATHDPPIPAAWRRWPHRDRRSWACTSWEEYKEKSQTPNKGPAYGRGGHARRRPPCCTIQDESERCKKDRGVVKIIQLDCYRPSDWRIFMLREATGRLQDAIWSNWRRGLDGKRLRCAVPLEEIWCFGVLNLAKSCRGSDGAGGASAR